MNSVLKVFNISTILMSVNKLTFPHLAVLYTVNKLTFLQIPKASLNEVFLQLTVPGFLG